MSAETAKAEWTRQICNLLVPIIEEGFRNIYANCVARSRDNNANADVADETNDVVQENVITFFQQTLRDIPKWTDAIVETEYQRIMDTDIDCREMLADLIRAAFTSYIRMLSEKTSSSNISTPSVQRFIHKVYIEAAR